MDTGSEGKYKIVKLSFFILIWPAAIGGSGVEKRFTLFYQFYFFLSVDFLFVLIPMKKAPGWEAERQTGRY